MQKGGKKVLLFHKAEKLGPREQQDKPFLCRDNDWWQKKMEQRRDLKNEQGLQGVISAQLAVDESVQGAR